MEAQMSTPVYGPPAGPLVAPGCLPLLEGAALGVLAAYFLEKQGVHEVFTILAAIAVLVIYVALYAIRYLRAVVSIIASLFWSGAAAYYKYDSMQPEIDWIWIGLYALAGLAFSLVMHWVFILQLKSGDPSRERRTRS